MSKTMKRLRWWLYARLFREFVEEAVLAESMEHEGMYHPEAWKWEDGATMNSTKVRVQLPR